MNGIRISEAVEEQKERDLLKICITTPTKSGDDAQWTNSTCAPNETEEDGKFAITELSQRIISLHNLIFKNTPVNERKQMVNNNKEFFNEFTKNGKLEIKDLINSKDGHQWRANEILESCKGFQSMLFITPPKIYDFKSPSPSPLIDIMQSLNDILSTEEEKRKMLDPELIKLLDGTPVQQPCPDVKKFEPKKWSRNISSLFSNENQSKVSINQKYSQKKTAELKNDPERQPFYPQNYNWNQNKANLSECSIINKNLFSNAGKSKPYHKPTNLAANQSLKVNGAHNPSAKGLKLPSKWWKKDNSEQAVNSSNYNNRGNTVLCSHNVTVKKEQIPKRETSSNSNKENSNIEKHFEAKNDNYNFPDGGWVCCFCQNYNFYGRVKCNRCTKGKSQDDCEGKPHHIIRKEMKTYKKNDENNMNNMKKMNKVTKLKMKKQAQAVKIQQVQVPISENHINDGSISQNPERLGDWICFTCSNLNFSFRKMCNRCKISRDQSDMHYQSFQVSAMQNCEPLIGFSYQGVMPIPYPNAMLPPQSYANNNQLQ